MKTYSHLYKQVFSWRNLNDAYFKAGKHKNTSSVRRFSKNYVLELSLLKHELCNKAYSPKRLEKFVLRDPKTRVICVSDFRDRVVHHALVNVLQPIFEPRFICDSFASRKGKGTLAAVKRFDQFKRELTVNSRRSLTVACSDGREKDVIRGYVFKADIYHYFQSVDHEVLIRIIAKYVKDDDIIWLIRKILENYDSGVSSKGMPLGNWTSQFFANVYLNELDQFVKHVLRAKHYIRYVDDFVILHRSKRVLIGYESRIKDFLSSLKLRLHPNKCSIAPLHRGTQFLGFRIFDKHKLVRKRNIYKIRRRIYELLECYGAGLVDADKVLNSLQGWSAYAMHANTYKLRRELRKEATAGLINRNPLRDAVRKRKP